ncbi:transposase [Streptomyces californicus]
MTTKIHLAADGPCRPLAFVLTPGQAGDAPTFPEVMARLRVPWPTGRPRTTPDTVLADKACSSRATRTRLRQRGIRAVIPQPSDQAANRKRRGRLGGRPPALRPRGLQAAQHRRTMHQQAQTMARPRHSLQQDRHHLPRRPPYRRHLHLVSEMIRKKRPAAMRGRNVLLNRRTTRRGARCRPRAVRRVPSWLPRRVATHQFR